METPDDDVSEPYPKTWSPPAETQRLLQVIDHVHKRQKPTCSVLKSLDLGAVLAISANNTEKPAEPDRDQDDEDPGVESGEY